jgi:hypothetical protein
MALSRTRGTSAIASTANTAGSTTNSSAIEQASTSLQFMFYGTITNGGTGPTIPMSVKLQVTYDGSNWLDTGIQFTAGITASTTYTFLIEAPVAGYTYRIQATGNTGQTVTIACWYDTLTSVV